MVDLKAVFAQYFPPKPAFTEKDVSSQVGRVFIVTGSNQGIGFELVKMLYPLGGTVYLACRSKERAETAIATIISTSPKPLKPSTLKFLLLDLSDLTTIKKSAAEFAAKEDRLDILWNNAGLGGQSVGASTKQHIEAHVGVNCVAPLLFTQELMPQLQNAAKMNGSARVVWTSSLMSDTHSPLNGVDFDSIEHGKTTNSFTDYAISKVGNYFLAVELARRYQKDGIISVVQNPGNLKTNIYSSQPKLLMMVVNRVLYDQKFGGYTLLYSGFTSDISLEKNNGAYIWPFGYIHEHSRADIKKAIEDGKAAQFWQWCERKYEDFI